MKKYSIRNINDVDILTFVKISAFIRYFEEERKYPAYSIRRLNNVPKKNYGYIVNIVTAEMEHEFIKSIEPELHLMVVARYADENMFKEYLIERRFGLRKYSYTECLKGYDEHLKRRLENVKLDCKGVFTVEWLGFLYKLYLRDANIFEVTQIMERLKKTGQVTEKDWLEMVATNRMAIAAYLLYVKGKINHNLLFGSDAEIVKKTYKEYSKKIVKHKYYDDPRLLQEEIEEKERNAELEWLEESMFDDPMFIEPRYERNYMKEYNFLSDLGYGIGKVEKFIASEETAECCRKSMEIDDWVEKTKKNLEEFKAAKYLVVWSYLYS